MQKSRDLDQRQRLIYFLMRLNDGYDSIRGQILLMDPLPHVNKAYCMIARVETQRNVIGGCLGGPREVAAAVKSTFTAPVSTPLADSDFGSSALYAKGGSNSRPKRDNKRAKGARFCDHCQRTGHTQDQCSKIIGYPDWYDGPRDNIKGKRSTKLAATVVSQPKQVADSPLDDAGSSKLLGQFDFNMVQALAQEMMKLLKGKGIPETSSDVPSFAHFAGMTSTGSHSAIYCAVSHSHGGSWIVDTGASDHMTYHSHFFTHL